MKKKTTDDYFKPFGVSMKRLGDLLQRTTTREGAFAMASMLECGKDPSELMSESGGLGILGFTRASDNAFMLGMVFKQEPEEGGECFYIVYQAPPDTTGKEMSLLAYILTTITKSANNLGDYRVKEAILPMPDVNRN